MQKWGNVIASLFFMIIGIGGGIGGILLDLGTVTEPGPGFFPFLAGATLTVLSAILLFRAWTGRSSGTNVFGNLWPPTLTILVFAVYVMILEKVGFIIAGTVLSVVVLCILKTNVWWIIIISPTIAIGSYILFDRVLGVPLPGGILEGIF